MIIKVFIFTLLIMPIALSGVSILHILFRKNEQIIVHTKENELKFVSVLVPAFNEESNIANKINNILSLDYPKNKLEIIIGSDGSTDNTVAICQRFASKFDNVIYIEEKRGGKANIINKLVTRAKGEYVLITDADTLIMNKDALKIAQSLNKDFVSAKLSYPKNTYWNLDYAIRSFESKFNRLLTSNGAFMFLKKEFFEPLPKYIIADDLFIPLTVLIKKGKSVLSEQIYCSTEDETLTFPKYFNKRARVIKGGLQTSFLLFRKLLINDFLSTIFLLSHKILRWFFLLLLFLNIFIFFGLKYFLLSVLFIFLLLIIKKTRYFLIDMIIPFFLIIDIAKLKNRDHSGWNTERH
ncbi:glycosyl transferase family 2 [Petrotoga mobilis SJ95]|uniref:Glycosyl transferase family 2 n=1 Tax=Petrotoga mobilis (strain DSM 10674 / SJ95) TaxID=403833 RepID=A9BJR0_PETMO|nr:glycosyltransferase [Petrotoga mobilis]ABX31653.1 glycosyl transferase family 2 [Petrotoga mobilis SJ95]